jgi:hypothetical protein
VAKKRKPGQPRRPESTLETAGDRSLEVPDEKRHWRVIGPFDETISDCVNLQCIKDELERRFGRHRFDVFDSGYATFVMCDPDDADVLDALEGFDDHLQNVGPFDENAVMQAMNERIHQEWADMGLGHRVWVLLQAGEDDLSPVLRMRTPDEAFEPMENSLYESGIV